MINWKRKKKQKETTEDNQPKKKITYEEKFFERILYILESVNLENVDVDVDSKRINIKDEYSIKIEYYLSHIISISFEHERFELVKEDLYYKKIKNAVYDLHERKLNEKYIKCIATIDDKNKVIARKAKLNNL